MDILKWIFLTLFGLYIALLVYIPLTITEHNSNKIKEEE